jgi:hypothetical protein
VISAWIATLVAAHTSTIAPHTVLPHGYPFRLLDLGPTGDVRVQVTTDAALVRDGAELPPMLAIEIMAQGSLVALPPAGGAGVEGPVAGLLAGVESVRWHGALRPGDRLTVRASLLGRLGPLVKARVELRRDEETVVEGELLLALRAPAGQVGG